MLRTGLGTDPACPKARIGDPPATTDHAAFRSFYLWRHPWSKRASLGAAHVQKFGRLLAAKTALRQSLTLAPANFSEVRSANRKRRMIFSSISEFRLNHLLLNILDVGELAPPGHIAVLGSTLNFQNESFHQSELIPVFFPEMVLTEVGSQFLPVLGP